jgi:dolichyl-phosphate beta-glucosyltransferase
MFFNLEEWSFLFSFFLITSLFLLLYLFFFSPKPIPLSKKELKYKDLVTGRVCIFPSPMELKSDYYVSVVIPAYNETKRLEVMLNETISYLDSRVNQEPELFTFEIIIVDDGSQDGTTDLANAYGKAYLKRMKREGKQRDFKVLTFERNRGKGGAVQRVSLINKCRTVSPKRCLFKTFS